MEKILKEQLKNELLLLYREAYFAKAQYSLLNKTYDIILSNSDYMKYTLAAIFDALEFSVLLKLTKMYDNDKKSITLSKIFNKVQSNRGLNSNKEIKDFVLEVLKEIEDDENIEKIKTYRDKVVSHMDKKYAKGLLNIKVDKQVPFELLGIYSNYAYEKLKKLYQLIYNETVLDTSQFDVLELECETIKKKFY